ncbi:MAG: hypothetical protein AAGL24_10095 [Pseudomonadota bacterium]
MDYVGGFNPSTGQTAFGKPALDALVNADPGVTEGSVLAMEAVKHPIEEILYCIEQRGLTPDKDDRTQLWQALSVGQIEFITANTTITVGSDPSDDQPTLQDALDYLADKLIAPGALVTLSMRAETHTYSADVVFDRPDVERIRIVGAALTGSFPAHGDFSLVGGTTAPVYSGAQRAADNALNDTMVRSRFATTINFTAGALRFPNGMQSLSNVLIDGAVGHDGLVITGGKCNLSNVAILGGENGLVTVLTSITGSNVVMSGQAAEGLSQKASYLELAGVVRVQGATGNGVSANFGANLTVSSTDPFQSRGNGGHGVALGWSSSAHIPGAQVDRNTQNGLWVIGNSSCYADSSMVVHNGENGAIASNGSFIDMGLANATSNNYVGAAHYGVQAVHGGHIYAAGIAGGTTFSPSVNTIGTTGGFISI